MRLRMVGTDYRSLGPVLSDGSGPGLSGEKSGNRTKSASEGGL